MSTKSRRAPAMIAATAAATVGIGLAGATPAYAQPNTGGTTGTDGTAQILAKKRVNPFDWLEQAIDNFFHRGRMPAKKAAARAQ